MSLGSAPPTLIPTTYVRVPGTPAEGSQPLMLAGDGPVDGEDRPCRGRGADPRTAGLFISDGRLLAVAWTRTAFEAAAEGIRPFAFSDWPRSSPTPTRAPRAVIFASRAGPSRRQLVTSPGGSPADSRLRG